jgi:hypothetical protein
MLEFLGGVIRIDASLLACAVPKRGGVVKQVAFLIAISSFLFGACISRAEDKRPLPSGQAQEAVQSGTSLAPPTPQQLPPSPPKVSFRDGQLTIVANNSSLGEILHAIHSQTGAMVEIPGNPTDRVFGQFGPGPARDVLSSLLNGSHFNYILLGSASNPDELQRVILTAKSGGPTTSAPEPQTSASNQPPQPAMNAPMPFRPGGANVVVAQPESADDQDATTDDSADATDDSTTDDQSDQTDDSAQTDDQQTDQQADQSGQDQQNGQPAVKTPEQMLQELQQRQQQLMQQQQQGVPGAAVPGPGPGPGQIPPH